MPAAANEVIKNRLAIANLFFYWIGSVLCSFKCLLEANGYIRRCQGSGCYVLPLDNFAFFADGAVLDSFQAGQSETGPVYDFATSTPLATQEETRQFVALADELAQQRPGALLRYPPTRGAPALTQALLQEMLALYLQRGLYAAYLERLVTQYALKRRCMAQAIRASRHLALPYPEQAGGVFFWVQIPDAVDAVLLWKRLRLQGVKLMPGTVFSLTGSAQRFLRLSYVGCPLEMIPEGIHCIDREIDWLLQNGAAHVGDSFCDIALPQQ